MKTYADLVKEYRKRQHDTVVDTIATGLTYVDEIAVDTGLLEETGILTELTQSVSGILPFVIISAVPHGQKRSGHGRRSRSVRDHRFLGGDSRHDGSPGVI